MFLRLLILFAALLAAPVKAQLPARVAPAIRPELVAERPAIAGQSVELAIVMHTRPGWHGYWRNPGDAGLPMRVEWRLPPGVVAGPLRYPVPQRLMVAGLMNYVYERDHAILLQLSVPAGTSGKLPLRASMNWLACTDEICVPEKGEIALDLAVGKSGAADPRFDEWRRALPRPLAAPVRFAARGDRLEVAVPLPGGLAIGEPYFYPADDGPVDYAAPQRFRRNGDYLIAELKRRGHAPARLAGVLSLGDGRGLEVEALPGPVPAGGTALGAPGVKALLFALLGALAGGMLLNLMPCVFPILALKALHLAKSGGDERHARRDALGYAAGAIVGTGALGAVLLAIRAGGSAAGWAFQLQDPRTILLLLLLSVAIALNLLRTFELPVISGGTRPTGSFGTGALAAFVATPCAGPFLGAALGTALLLPAAASILVFAALGLGLAVPFLLVAFVPSLRRRLPRPGPWMARLQRFLAIPMAATAAACLWLLWRQGGQVALGVGIGATALLAGLLGWTGWRQRGGPRAGFAALGGALFIAAGAVALIAEARPAPSVVPLGAARWSPAAVDRALRAGRPVFAYFTAGWCVSCKVNEATAIERASTRDAFKSAGVQTLVGDWTNGDPDISRLIESRGRAGVPLYLWYEPGRAEPEELPQILTASMLSDRARRDRRR